MQEICRIFPETRSPDHLKIRAHKKTPGKNSQQKGKIPSKT